MKVGLTQWLTSQNWTTGFLCWVRKGKAEDKGVNKCRLVVWLNREKEAGKEEKLWGIRKGKKKYWGRRKLNAL